jgi:hypothetical protein
VEEGTTKRNSQTRTTKTPHLAAAIACQQKERDHIQPITEASSWPRKKCFAEKPHNLHPRKPQDELSPSDS